METETETETATWCCYWGAYATPACGPEHVHYDVEYDVETGRVLTSAEEQARLADEAHVAHEAHVDYPHEPGRLYDCPACEGKCHCAPGHAECIYEGDHNGLAEEES